MLDEKTKFIEKRLNRYISSNNQVLTTFSVYQMFPSVCLLLIVELLFDEPRLISHYGVFEVGGACDDLYF